jgi:hypothetical protein
MRKQMLGVLASAAFLCVPERAHATIFVSFPDVVMSPTDSLVIPITITTNASEEINAVDLYLQVEDGLTFTSGPYASFLDMANGPGATIWDAVSSTQAEYGDPWDTTSDQAGDGAGSTGLKPAFAAFATAVSGPDSDVPASGVLAYVTFDTNGAIPGLYNVFLESDDLGFTLMAKTSGPLELGSEYFLDAGTITVVPEPPSVVLGICAAVGLLSLVVHRRRPR